MFQKTIVIILLSILPHHLFAQEARLVVRIKGCKNEKGEIKYSLFKSAQGFPSKNEKAFQTGSAKISGKEAQIIISKLPLGEYAISILHDENNNNKMDFNLLGIPKEGYGTSNDANKTFSAPKYEEAKFRVDKIEKAISVTMVYW